MDEDLGELIPERPLRTNPAALWPGDTEVPIQFSQDLYQEILSAGIPVEYYEYDGNNHNLSDYILLAIRRTIEFFDWYLKEGG